MSDTDTPTFEGLIINGNGSMIRGSEVFDMDNNNE